MFTGYDIMVIEREKEKGLGENEKSYWIPLGCVW